MTKGAEGQGFEAKPTGDNLCLVEPWCDLVECHRLPEQMKRLRVVINMFVTK